jgi:hypothetical protein
MAFYLGSEVNVAKLNDQLRKKGDTSLGKIVCTSTITALSGQGMINVINAVKNYDDWSESNDPYGEHDYGRVEVDGVSYIWKIDYYDLSYTYGVDASERNNTARCRRVLTIMRSDEY